MLDSESQARLEQSEEELTAAVDIRNRSCALQVAAQEQILVLESKEGGGGGIHGCF